mgnify:CR=1 FL=1
MTKAPKVVFVCQSCGAQAPKWMGRCVDCGACVMVCPTGIDIRDGSQLECINCGLCVDACDGILGKIGRPTGLIAYDTDLNIQARTQNEPARYRVVRARTVLYAAIIVAVASSLPAKPSFASCPKARSCSR